MIATAIECSTKAVAYLRRSTDKQEQSLGDQRDEIYRFATEKGFELVDEYVDDAISGTSAKRPGFQQMIADAKCGHFQAVIVWNSDRFSRGDVTETEHYRYLLREAGVTLLSVTEDYLHRESFDGDILRTVKQFQNRQFSISLSQNTLRGQVSAVKDKSDPGRPCPYGYDREIVGPDGQVLYQVRFCPGGIREVMDAEGKVTAIYRRGQSLRKPGKECKGRMILSKPERVQVVKDIYQMCLDGMGFKGIADALNDRGISSPRGNLWSFTTIKSMLGNPIYRGDLVWNRKTESKFYTLHKGKCNRMKNRMESGKVTVLPESDWIVVPESLPAIVSREDWDKAQLMIQKRCALANGKGKQKDRWLLSAIMKCGHCNSAFWGQRRRKGHIPGRKEVITNYYSCSGRRRYGKKTCPIPTNVRAEKLEAFVVKTISSLIYKDAAVDDAIEKFVQTVANQNQDGPNLEHIQNQICKIDETIDAFITNLDPANLALVNAKLTQLRKQRESLEADLRMRQLEQAKVKPNEIRQWARKRLSELDDAINGRRDEATRQMIACYVSKIIIYPESRTGEIVLNPDAMGLFDPAQFDAVGK